MTQEKGARERIKISAKETRVWLVLLTMRNFLQVYARFPKSIIKKGQSRIWRKLLYSGVYEGSAFSVKKAILKGKSLDTWGTQQIFMARLHPDIHPLFFLTIFNRKGTSFPYLSFYKTVPFSHTNVRTVRPFGMNLMNDFMVEH